ncbi:MAG: IPT/TIG domain-containing protein [Balneola sp.]
MKVKIKLLPVILLLFALVFTTCKDDNSIFDPDYESPEARPVITGISPVNGYLAGVDSVIVTGEGFSNEVDEMTINFGGSPGVVKVASETQLVVRPGVISGTGLPVVVSRRGAEFLSESVPYTLRQPQGFYPGTDNNSVPTTPAAVDGNNNVYTIINRNGVIRYTRIAPDGTITRDLVKYPGEPRPDPEDSRPYPGDSTMRFTSYSDLEIGPNDDLFLSQQSIRAIFTKTFGNDLRESVWAASSSGNLKINDMVFDDNGFLWVVGLDSDQIHRFNASSKAETKFPFTGQFNSVAYFDNNNELFVGGLINGSQQIWKFSINGSGNLNAGELYFDYGANYDGNITSLILASNGELLIGNSGETSIVRVYPSLRHEPFYPGMIKQGTFGITWRDDEIAVVVTEGNDASVNFTDMYDRMRAGIFGF